MPAPGTVETLKYPTGPGIRVDSGIEAGEVISGNFDSMLAKLIVTGSSREQALERSRRALDELVITGMPTVVPFHASVVRDPAFAPDSGPFSVHTRWIETEFENDIAAWSGQPGVAGADDAGERQSVVVEVGGKRLEVTIPAGLGGLAKAGKQKVKKTRAQRVGAAATAASGDALTAPMQGTIVKVAVANGEQVAEGDLVVVLEAMKMEQPLTAHKAGTVRGLTADAGQTVAAGAVIATIED
jgi:acetyl-CoA/propionyl-CoA carboxylase biotin carboxyl carrier protein